MDFLAQAGRALRADRRGVTAVEYGIMAALIATALVAAVASLGPALSTAFGNIATAMDAK